MFATSCQSQSAVGKSIVPNFVNNLAQSCVGSSQRNYVNSIHLLPQLLQAGYFHTGPWLDENHFLKACAWFDPMFARIEILIANTSTTYHRDEWLGHTYAMHDKHNYEIDMRWPKNHPFPSWQGIKHHGHMIFNHVTMVLDALSTRTSMQFSKWICIQ